MFVDVALESIKSSEFDEDERLVHTEIFITYLTQTELLVDCSRKARTRLCSGLG